MSHAVFIDSGCLENNKYLEEINLESCTKVNDNLLMSNRCLKKFKGNKILSFGDYCLYHNNGLEYINLSSMETTGKCLLAFNIVMKKIRVKNLRVYNNEILISNTIVDKSVFTKKRSNFIKKLIQKKSYAK